MSGKKGFAFDAKEESSVVADMSLNSSLTNIFRICFHSSRKLSQACIMITSLHQEVLVLNTMVHADAMRGDETNFNFFELQ
jgi:hypothetical protein